MGISVMNLLFLGVLEMLKIILLAKTKIVLKLDSILYLVDT